MFTLEQTEELKTEWSSNEAEIRKQGDNEKRKEKKEHTGIMQICRQELKFKALQEGAYEATKLHKLQEEFLLALPYDGGVSLELLHRTLWVRPHVGPTG